MTSRNLRLGHNFCFAIALLLLGCGIAQAQELEGTWRLVMRKLPDGATQVPPAVLGAYTAYKGLQNLNVFSHTPEGKPAFVSRISTYKLSGTEYTATLLVLALDDGSGKPTTYNLTGATETTPVTREGGRLAFKLPFGEPSVVFEGDKFTATAGGRFVDYWERVHQLRQSLVFATWQTIWVPMPIRLHCDFPGCGRSVKVAVSPGTGQFDLRSSGWWIVGSTARML